MALCLPITFSHSSKHMVWYLCFCTLLPPVRMLIVVGYFYVWVTILIIAKRGWGYIWVQLWWFSCHNDSSFLIHFVHIRWLYFHMCSFNMYLNLNWFHTTRDQAITNQQHLKSTEKYLVINTATHQQKKKKKKGRGIRPTKRDKTKVHKQRHHFETPRVTFACSTYSFPSRWFEAT